MNPDRQKRISKFLSLVLRHEPERVGVVLGTGGWVSIDALLAGAQHAGFPIDREELVQVVAGSDKQRFAINGGLIRANQGHSVEVDLGLLPTRPPELLFHGTVERFLPGIRAHGLLRGQRQHVHLSPDVATASKVGARRGKPVILTVAATRMHDEGHVFYVSTNGVWLTEHVPVEFIEWP
jgi:putative RNA 2'-phosphotransferase